MLKYVSFQVVHVHVVLLVNYLFTFLFSNHTLCGCNGLTASPVLARTRVLNGLLSLAGLLALLLALAPSLALALAPSLALSLDPSLARLHLWPWLSLRLRLRFSSLAMSLSLLLSLAPSPSPFLSLSLLWLPTLTASSRVIL